MANRLTRENPVPLPALLFLDENLLITEVNIEAVMLLGKPGTELQGAPVENMLSGHHERFHLRSRLEEL